MTYSVINIVVNIYIQIVWPMYYQSINQSKIVLIFLAWNK